MAAEHLKNAVEANEENFPGGLSNDKDISFVHFSKPEAAVYDTLQGGAFIDDEMLPIRSYKPLGELLKKPEFVQMMVEILNNGAESAPAPNSELHQFQERGFEMVQQETPEWVAAPGDDLPEIKQLAKKGIKPDTIICYMPANVILFLGQVTDGVVHLNPNTGFPEFGWNVGNFVKSVVRVGATAVGAIIGGPSGAAIGSTIGSAVTGRKPRDWFNPAMQAAGMTAIGTSLMNGMSGGSGGGAGGGMGAFGSMFSGGSGGGKGAVLPMPSGGSGGGASGLGNMLGQSGGGSGGGGNMMGNMMQMAPYALNALSGFMAKDAEKERYELEKKERAQFLREREEMEEKNRRRFGFYTPLKREATADVMPNPRFGEAGQEAYLFKGDPRYDTVRNGNSFAEGGEVVVKKKVPLRKGILITGPGKGQSDVIHTNAPEGSYIIPADVMSMLGDGSSEAGAEALNDYFEKKLKGLDKETRDFCLSQDRGKPTLKCAFSRDEGFVRPSLVVAVGGGHHSKGVKDLDEFLENVREHKISNGNKLAPKAKSVQTYMEA